jgi:hypothetical protein
VLDLGQVTTESILSNFDRLKMQIPGFANLLLCKFDLLLSRNGCISAPDLRFIQDQLSRINSLHVTFILLRSDDTKQLSSFPAE